MNMKGSGSSAINSFSGGMVSDVDALSTKNNTYKYAENARIAQEGSVGSLSNIEDFELLSFLPSDAGEFMAYYRTNKYTILVSKDTDKLRIYKYITIDGIETLSHIATLIDSVDSSRISNIKHLSITASIESDKIERLYIADGIHAIYSINMYTSTSVSDDIELDIYKDSVLIGRYFSTYDASVEYSIGDTVSYNGYFWKSLSVNQSTTPVAGPSWELLGSTDSKLANIKPTIEQELHDYMRIYSDIGSMRRYLGEYSSGVIYDYDSAVLYDGKFYACIYDGGTSSIPTDSTKWEYKIDLGEVRLKPDLSAVMPDKYTMNIAAYNDNWFGEYKQTWVNYGQYYISDIVRYYGRYYSSAVDLPTDVPTNSSEWTEIIITPFVLGEYYFKDNLVVYSDKYYIAKINNPSGYPITSADWEYIEDLAQSSLFTSTYTPAGSIVSNVDGFIYPYRGEYSTNDTYFKNDVTLYNGIYWKFGANFLGSDAFGTANSENVGNTSELDYEFVTWPYDVTTKRLYKNTTLVGVYRDEFLLGTGYYLGEAVLYNGVYYKSIIFNPSTAPSDTGSWQFVVDSDDSLFTIVQRSVSTGGDASGTPTYDIAKIQIGSSLYKSPYVEISTESGGSLSIGKYYYVIRYTNNAGAESSEVYVSDGINATKSNSVGGIIDSETGAADVSNIGINLSIRGVDNDAYGINVYRIYYDGSGIGYKAMLIYSDKISRVNGVAYPINVFDSSDSSVLNDVTESIQFNRNVESASVIENKDGILFAGDINIEKDSVLNYDTRAFAFDHNGSFKYRNSTDPHGINPYEIKIGFINDDDSVFGLAGKDRHDFINDDIYTKDRYRDVKYRYKFSDDQLNGKVYGGIGKNISYEFTHTYLIAAKESSIFTNSEDNDWFDISQFKNFTINGCNLDINSSDQNHKDLSCKSLIDSNIHRDDLVIKVGDKDREISKMTIRNQMRTATDNPLDIVDISAFGIKPHTGKLDYSNSLIANIFSGFKRNEIFRFAVRFKLKNGTHTEPMWISDIRFPANYMTGRASYTGPNSSAPDIFSFSSFVAPEDIEEGIDLLDTVVSRSSEIVSNGFESIDYEDKLGSNNLSSAELLVKPLGLKFEFDNIPEDVESAKILYQELSPIERTILGQFIVSRIGMFSNSGSETDATGNVYYESQSNGFEFPHPTPSMKYSYGIMPAASSLIAGSRNEFNVAVNGLSSGTETLRSFDKYSSVASPIIFGDNNEDGHGDWGKVDKRLSRTSAVSTSPYFSDIKNYMLISPEISYIGGAYSDIISSIGNNIVFENLIYSKNTKTDSNASTSIDDSIRTFTMAGISVQPDSIFTRGGLLVNSQFNSPPFNYSHNDQYDYTNYFTIANKFVHAGVPPVMYSGAFFDEEERVSSVADKSSMGIFLGLCGAPLYSVVESVLSYKVPHADGLGRIGDSIFKIDDNATLAMSSTKYSDGVNVVNGISINIQSNVTPPKVEYIIDSGYSPGATLNISDHKKGYEKVWDDGTTGESNPTNLPISLKTFMSGNAFLSETFFIDEVSSTSESAIRVVSVSLDNRFNNFKYRLGGESSLFGKVGSLNSVTMKYYKSILPSRNYYNRNTSNYGIDEYNDSYMSVFKQNGSEFHDYESYLSDRAGVKLRGYAPYNDTSVTTGNDFVWDFSPISIKKSSHTDIKTSPTGPFDLSETIKIDGYSGYLNYSKSLSADSFGRKSQIGSDEGDEANASVFSSIVRKSGSGINDSLEFKSLVGFRRGRISGKHGAGVIVSLSDSIPMIGHMMLNDYKLDLFTNVQLSKHISKMNDLFAVKDTAPGGVQAYNDYVDQFKRTRLYWHMLDGACAAHTSTYIVDIRSKTNKLFKSASYTDKRNAKYIESAQSINLGSNLSHKYYVFGGGTYVTLFDYTNTYGNRPEPHVSYDNDPDSDSNWNSVANACQTGRLNMLVPIESSINTHVDSGDTFHKHNDPWLLETTTPGVNSPNSGYTSSVITITGGEDEYMYSDSFSAKKDFNAIENNFSKDDVYNSFNYKSRVIASEKKILGEQNDSWSVFKQNNYIDLNPSNGSVNSLKSFGSKLYSFQDKAVALLSVNERSLISDNSGDNSQLLLGTGGVLPYYSYISESYGLSSDTMSAINKSANGIYFYDKINQSICKVSGMLYDISASTNNKLISKSISASGASIIVPWHRNGEVLFNFDDISYFDKDNQSILFSESGSTFESFLTSKFKYAFEFGSDIRVVRGVGGSDWMCKPTDNTISSMMVSFITNESIMNTKIFDSADINLSWTHADTLNNVLVPGSELNIYSSYSNSIANTGGLKPITSIELARQNKNGDIHYAIPRVDGTISKMRDKYLLSTYYINGMFSVSLPYIKTNYRYSII
jgi:hypothetical protein